MSKVDIASESVKSLEHQTLEIISVLDNEKQLYKVEKRNECLVIYWDKWHIILTSFDRYLMVQVCFRDEDTPAPVNTEKMMVALTKPWPSDAKIRVTSDHLDSIEVYLDGDPKGEHSVLLHLNFFQYDQLGLYRKHCEESDEHQSIYSLHNPDHVFDSHGQDDEGIWPKVKSKQTHKANA